MNKRATNGEAYEPTNFEQLANIISHAIAIPLAIIATSWLLVTSREMLQYNASLVYGLSGTLLFISSSLYHSCELLFGPQRRKLRYYLHIFDRATIYTFIAASYTPWLTLKQCDHHIPLKLLVWLLALIGIMYQYAFHERFKTAETVFYIVLSTAPSIAVFSTHDSRDLALMSLGGLVYLIGVIFFKLDGIIPFAHAIWHLHVVIGAGTQCYALRSALMLSEVTRQVQRSKLTESNID